MNRRPAFLPRARIAGVALTAAALLLGACSSDSDSSGDDAPAAEESRTVRFGVVPVSSAAPLYLAQEQGIFDKYDLDVSFTVLNGGAATVPALTAGEIEVGQSNLLSVAQAKTQGIDLPCIAGDFRIPDTGNLVAIVAGKDSGVSSLKELDGATVAVNATGGINQLIAMAALDKAGVDPSSVDFVGLEFPTMAAALDSKRVAAVVTFEPLTAGLMSQGNVMLDPNPATAIIDDPMYSCYIADRSWVEDNPETARDLVAALAEAQELANSDRALVEPILIEQFKVPPPLAPNVALPQWAPGAVTVADLTPWIDAATEFKILNGDVDPAELTIES